MKKCDERSWWPHLLPSPPTNPDYLQPGEIILGDIILVWIIVILANTILVIKILASATQWSPAPSLVVSIAAIHNASFCHCLISMTIAFGFCKM